MITVMSVASLIALMTDVGSVHDGFVACNVHYFLDWLEEYDFLDVHDILR
jgi:hypothetical protein